MGLIGHTDHIALCFPYVSRKLVKIIKKSSFMAINDVITRKKYFFYFKLTYLLNYWRFCDFDPSRGQCLAIYDIFHTLGLNKPNLTSIDCLKCIIKCLHHFVYKFCQFLDSKLTYLLSLLSILWFWPLSGPIFVYFMICFTLWSWISRIWLL
jgi:hypothetical protein